MGQDPSSGLSYGRCFAIGAGSNLGDRPGHLALAMEAISRIPGIVMRARSRLVESTAVGGPSGQAPYRNGCCIISTDLGAHQVLDHLLRLESACGRTREVAWGPRTIDLDLLLADDDSVVADPVLVLPHPRLTQRAFVLEPLAEIAPDWIHPLEGVPIAVLARRLRRG